MGNKLPANTPNDDSVGNSSPHVASTLSDTTRKVTLPLDVSSEQISEAVTTESTGQQDIDKSSIVAGLLRGVLFGMRTGIASVIRVTLINLFDAPLQWFRPSSVRWQDYLNARAGVTEAKLYNTWEMLVVRDGYKPVLQTITGALFANTFLGCIMFGVFETAEDRLLQHPSINPAITPWIAGGLAGLAMAGPSTAIENVRIWALNHQKEVCSQAGRSLLQIVMTQPKAHLRQGFLLTCLRDVLSTSAFFGISYSVFEDTSEAWGEETHIPMYKTFLAGGAAAIVADLIGQPLTRLKEERAGIYPPQKGLPVLRLYHVVNPASLIACAIPGGCALLMFEYTKRLQRGDLGDNVFSNMFPIREKE